MFVQHSCGGLWIPLLPLHLADLGFSNAQLGNLFGVLSLATIVSPWIGGQLADRLMPASWVILISNLLCSGVLLALSHETRYGWIVGLMLVQQILFMPTFSLCNHIIFSHLRDGTKNFGYIRMFGTAGWVVGSLAIGYWLHKPSWIPWAAGATTADGMRLGAITLFAAAWLCLLLPPTPPAKTAVSRMAALAALKLMRHADVAVLMLVSFLLSFALPFVAPHGGLFLRALGVADAQVAPILSLGQVVEVFGFFSMAWLLGRVSIKTLIVIGLTCWVARFAIWTVGSPLSLVVASMGLHGLCYAFFYGMGMVYLDRRATPDIRASAQGMHLVVTSGLGIWPANWITARIADHYSHPTPGGGSAVDYSTVFLFPLVLCVVCWLLMALFFRPPRELEQH